MNFVVSSLFQAMGNSMPPLIAAGIRNGLSVGLLIPLSRWPGFELRWIWWLSVAAVAIQLLLNVWLVRREFRTRLVFGA